MVLVIGGRFSGRHEFASRLACDGSSCIQYDVTEQDALSFWNECESLGGECGGDSVAALSRVCERISSYAVVIATEMGLGVVPMDRNLRELREKNGRLNCALAKISETVVVMTSGLPRVIKGTLKSAACGNFCYDLKKPLNVAIFRHGITKSNEERRFAGGLTDVPLSDVGLKELEQAKLRLAGLFEGYEPSVKSALTNPDVVFVSPQTRAVQTARSLFPMARLVIKEGLREMKLGLLENMTHEELSCGKFADGSESEANRELYQKWLDSGGAMPVPSSAGFCGESIQEFCERVSACAKSIFEEANGSNIVIVAHGGVQMAFCHQLFAKGEEMPYQKWQGKNLSFRFGQIRQEAF